MELQGVALVMVQGALQGAELQAMVLVALRVVAYVQGALQGGVQGVGREVGGAGRNIGNQEEEDKH